MDGPAHTDPSVDPAARDAPTPPADLARTLGDLRASGWESVPVAEEMRRNTPWPASPRAVAGARRARLRRHRRAPAGERHPGRSRHHPAGRAGPGQDPGHPLPGRPARRVAAHRGGLGDQRRPLPPGLARRHRRGRPSWATTRPIAWVHRSQRYGEKLATPDTSIADLIGEVDPIKIAEGRYLSDELALHYGLIPRVNRGIFAINELPDLSERIQVGLLNVLEERDVQIRGHRIRLPLDITLVATANPEDYTNRGRIITPLKDRFGAQIRTHYPFETMTEVKIMEAEAELPTAGIPVTVPAYLKEVVAEVSQLARRSSHLNQRSGVSVRLSIANYETLVANSVRRALRTGEPVAVPRISDLSSLVPSTQGKIEVEAMEEGHEDEVVAQLVAAATLSRLPPPGHPRRPAAIVAAFTEQVVVHAGDDLPSAGLPGRAGRHPRARAADAGAGRARGGQAESPALMASALEFLLEGLHLTKRLNKDASGARALYRGRK